MYYKTLGVVAVSGKLDRLLQDVEELTPEELRVLSKVVLRRLAIPLRDPKNYFDDWDDSEVDKAYTDAW